MDNALLGSVDQDMLGVDAVNTLADALDLELQENRRACECKMGICKAAKHGRSYAGRTIL